MHSAELAAMILNWRHKAILFATLVLTGSRLLAGAELKEALGMMMLGAALAWAIGSDVVSKSYSKLKAITSILYLWIRLPLAMIFAGCALGAALILSRANPVIAIAVMSVLGIVIAPLTSLPSRKTWLRILFLVLAPAAFLLAVMGILAIALAVDKSWEHDAERLGQLIGGSFFAFLVGIWWLSKGWRLIIKGITGEIVAGPVLTEGPPRKAFGHYLSLLLGVLILTLWLGLLAWSASSDWAYGPRGTTGSKAKENSLAQIAFVVLLAWWPYAAWKKILAREPNCDTKYLVRHKRVVAAAGMASTVVLCSAVTFGIQNGYDRIVTDQITKTAAQLKDVASKIGNLKRQDLRTTREYIQAYSEIALLAVRVRHQDPRIRGYFSAR